MVSKTEAKAACAKFLYAYVANNPLNATDPSGMQETGTDTFFPLILSLP